LRQPFLAVHVNVTENSNDDGMSNKELDRYRKILGELLCLERKRRFASATRAASTTRYSAKSNTN
jgi:hypothetical protein